MTHDHSEESAVSGRIEEMYARHSAKLLKHCMRKLQDQQLAEDIVQEAFLKALLYLRSGRTIESSTTFLHRIADNLMIDEIRRTKGQVGISLDVLQEQGFDPSYESVDGWQKTIEVGGIIEGLRKKEAKLLSMRYLEGLQPSDIARRIGIAPNTVAARLHRLMRRLTLRYRGERVAAVGSDSR